MTRIKTDAHHLAQTFAKMPTLRCVICNSYETVFPWPKRPETANEWTSRINIYNPHIIIKKSSGICYKHFEESDFTNFAKWSEKRKVEKTR